MLDDLVEALPGCQNPEAVWSTCVDFFSGHGFDKLIYIDRPLGNMRLHTTLSSDWLEHYEDAGYARIDPFFTYCCANHRPMGTGVDYLPDYPFLNGPEQRLIREAGETGMRAGVSCTVRRAGPGGVGGWNLGSSLPRKEVETIFAESGSVLRLAAHYAHERLAAMGESNRAPVLLSKRETECLQWSAQGLRTKQIADKLSIRPVTVELYLKNARHKLGAATREQAVALAVMHRHITL